MDCPIAIVGIGLRLPGGCHDTESFWDLLVNKRDARKEVPADRFNIDGFHSSQPADSAGNLSVKHGYFLDEPIDRFDAGFFSMSQAEVERLDPQQRLLLEVVYEAMENAGETEPEGRNVGVYAGSFASDWAHMQGKDARDESVYGLTGRDDFVHANRVSYEFNFVGPSMTVKTACSSSLVALHLACEALQRGDCTGAIVCAANLILSPDTSLALDRIGVLSEDGSSKSFDGNANGYARGEAIEAIYIKRLDDARRDRNPVRAVIRGTAINSDGKTRGLFTPSPDAHAALIRRAYAKARIPRPTDTPLVECHGTGTATGDPLELAAVAGVLGGGEDTTYIGSVKPNIGHGEAAAGLSSLIKAVLALERNTIPPNIKFNTPNPKIPFAESNLNVPTEAIPWPSTRAKRVSVNSFGMGGANAHVIVEAASPVCKQNGIHTPRLNGIHGPGHNGGTHAANGVLPARSIESTGGEQRLLVFSSHSEASLQKMLSSYKEFIEREPFHLSDLAYTLSVRRHVWNVRSFCVTDGQTFQTNPGSRAPKFRGLLFIFTGQGAQWPGMGRELIQDFCTFREDIRKMDFWLAESDYPPLWTIEDLLSSSTDINSAEFAQPICTALQLALVNLLRQWNVLPAAVVGHSSGEIAAAYAAGALGMKEALLVSYYRGVATSGLRQPGAMGAVGLGRDDLEGLLAGNAVVACENSRSSVTISGSLNDVEASLDRICRMRPGVLVRKLKIDRAYHSSHMQEVSERYQNLMASIKPAQGKLAIPFFSSVTGRCTLEATCLGPSYWRSNMESPVLFLSAVESAFQAKDKWSTALEIGPHSTLSGPFRQICQALGEKVNYTNTLARGDNCTKSVLIALGHLFCQGLMPRLSALNPPGVTMSNLPSYPWNHDTSYWHESRISRQFRTREFPEHELLGARVTGGTDLEPSWRKLLDVNHVSWLNDHVVSGDVIFPGAGYIALIGEAIRQLSKSSSYTIRNCSIGAAMILRDGQSTEIITRLRTRESQTKLQPSTWYDFSVSSYDGNKWHHHVNGEVHTGQNSGQNMVAPHVKTIRQLKSGDWYRTSRATGLEYGPSFRLLQNIRCAVGHPVASANVYNDMLPKGSSYAIHPIAIDNFLQCCIIAPFKGHLRKMNKLVLPIHIDELHVRAQEVHTDLHLRGAITSHNASSLSASGQIQTLNGSAVLQCENIQFRTLDNNTVDTAENSGKQSQHLLEWKPDIDLIDANKLLHRTVDLTSCIKLVEELSILCSIETARVLKNIESSVPHLRRFKEWIDQFVTTIQQDGSKVVQNTSYMFQLTSEERQPHIRRLLEEALDTPAKDMAIAITRMYNAAEDIFRGNMEPLAVLLADDVLTRLYNFLNTVDHEQFLQLLGHGKPNMRILEIGAGTGGFTSTILPALSNPSLGHMFGTYTYTDISSGFFKAAKERFREYPNLEFAVLDISQDLQTQGVEQHGYDLVVAANVLHATPNLHKTLSNCRSLLRPGGRLLLLELFPEAKFANYIYGFLSGWWLGESDGRPNEPYIDPAKWDTALRNAGFDGIEASIMDQESPCHLDAMMIARASESQSFSGKRLSLLLSESGVVSERIRAIQSRFELAAYDVSLCTLSNLPSSSMDIVSLLEIDESGPFFKDISEIRFNGLIHLIEKCYSRGNKILWITGPAQISAQDPYYAMVLGLARTLRLELGSVFATLELEMNELGPSQCDSILQVFRKLQSKSSLSYDSMDYEFAVANGNVNIPRYITVSTNVLLGKTMDSTQSAKRLFVKSPGLLQSLQWGLQSRAQTLLDGEVEIVVKTASLNSWDYDVARGNLQSTLNLGLECAGLVCRIGANAKHNLQIGDRVLCWSPGSLATHVQVDARYCIKLPDNLPLDEAVTLSTAYATMIRGLVELCNLAQGESVLISSAAGPDGTAAIQIARMVGAKIFVTAATEEQKVLLETKHGIPQSHIFSSNDDSFVHSVLDSTNARGVDVVVNFSSDGHSYNRWKCIAEGGSILELSKRDPSGHEKLDCSLLGGNRSFYAFDMVTLLQQKPSMAHRLLETVLDLYNCGSIKPISPVSKFHPSGIKEAFQHLHANRHIGATCIEFPQDPTMLSANCFANKSSFRADRAYILVGGLGGLGKSAAMWLAERGAGHIIFLSRSATEHATANVSFLSELRALGCSVEVVAGNVADAATVERVVAKSPKPIAGVVHLPVVVWDRPLLEMSHEDWEIAVFPKVLGAWNLHDALQKHQLDFFVILGSANGVRGNHGQANYAAANTFLDAFVQYRQHLNLPASIMDLGPVEDIGYLAGRHQLMDGFRRAGTEMVDENEFLESFNLAIRSCYLPLEKATSSISGFVNRAQFITGAIQRPYDVRAQVFARIYNGARNDNAAVGQSSVSGKKENKMQQFMEHARANPQSWAEDAAASEAFLASQILEAAKSLLIFDDSDDDQDSGLDMSVSDLAIDSLVAIELQSWWRQSMGTQVSVLELTKNTSPLELGKLARKMILADLKVET